MMRRLREIPGIREKIRCGLRFFGVFLCGFAVFGPPLRFPPPLLSLLNTSIYLIELRQWTPKIK